ncbi:MAG: hypothetical protein HY348_06845 [Nitrospira defluvii]|nr:hypothetical protein [Nitrospira defluvii]
MKKKTMWRKWLACPLLGIAFPLVIAVGAGTPADPVVSHLEYLGYRCDVVEEGIRAQHNSKLPFVVSSARGGILLQTGFPGKKDPPEASKRFIVLNMVNARMQVARGFWTREGDLFVNAWMPGLYDKLRFAAYLEAWEQDLKILREAAPDLSPFLLERTSQQ